MTDAFRVGVPKVSPKIPAGWMLRTSQFDFPAAISPEAVEWLIAPDGVLHEVRPGLKAERLFTGRSQVVCPPFGTACVGDGLKEVVN